MRRDGHKHFSSVVIALVHFYFLTFTNLNGSKILCDDTFTHRGIFKLPYFASGDLTADIAITATCISSSTTDLTRETFLRQRISYYSDSSATFNPDLLQIIRSSEFILNQDPRLVQNISLVQEPLLEIIDALHANQGFTANALDCLSLITTVQLSV